MRRPGRHRLPWCLAPVGCALLLLCSAPTSVRAEDTPHPATLLVLGPTGRPAEGAAVVEVSERLPGRADGRGARKETARRPLFDAELRVLAITDARGRVPEFARLAAGRGRLAVHAPGLAAVLLPATKQPTTVRLLRAEPSLGVLRLSRRQDVTKRVVIAVPQSSAADLAHLSRIDKHGRFVLPALHAGHWRLLLRHQNGRLQTLGVVRAGVDLGSRSPLARTGVQGRILDADGTHEDPVPDLEIRFVPLPDGETLGARHGTVRTDADGGFEAVGLLPGVYRAEVVTPGWRFDQGAPRVQAERERVRELDPWFARRLTAARGRVVDARARPLPQVTLRLVSDPARPPPRGGYGTLPAPVLSDAEGRFELAGITPAEGYRLIASAPGHSPWVSNPFRVDRGKDTLLRDVRLRSGWRIDLRVRDVRGEPVADADVVATAATRPSAIDDDEWAAVVRRAKTGPDGRTALLDLPETDVLCRVSAPGMLPGSVVVAYPRVDDQRRADITLEAAVGLTGQLLVSDGGPTGPFVVRAAPRDGSAVVEVVPDAEGRFTFPNLRDSATDLQVRLARAEPHDVIARVESVIPGVDEHVEILLPVVLKIEGSVVDLDPQGPAGQVLVEARQYDPMQERYAWRVVRRVAVARGDDVQRFRVEGLPPGVYALRGVQADLDSDAQTVRLESEDLGEVELLLPAGARIAGTVLDAESKPLLGAEVLLTRMHGEDAAGVREEGPLRRATDERGDFVFDDIAPGLWRLEAREEQLTPSMHLLRVRDGEVLVLDAVQLGAGGTLVGRLEDVEGRPLEGAHVFVRRFEGDEPERRVRTDHRGAYRLPHLRPGTYRLRVAPDTVAGAPQLEAVAEVRVGETTRVDFTSLREGVIEGTVRRDGAPVAGALVDLVHDPSASAEALRRYRTSTRADGRFAVRHLPPGRYHVRLQNGAWRSERDIELAAGDRLDLDLETWAARLRGTVVTRTGTPVPGAHVHAAPLGEDGRPLPAPGFHAEGRTGPDGAFVLRGVPVGVYTVAVSAVGLPPGRYEGAEADLPGADYPVEIVLGRGGHLNMQVRDENERGVTGARVWLEDEQGLRLNREAYVTGAGGRMHIEGVPAGHVRVRVHARGYGRPALHHVDVQEGRQTDLAVIVRPGGSLHVRVGAEDGDPALRARIDLLRADTGELIASRRPLSTIRLASPWGYVPRTGELTISDLEAGRYVVVITAGRTYEPARVPVEVKSAAVSHVHVTLVSR